MRVLLTWRNPFCFTALPSSLAPFVMTRARVLLARSTIPVHCVLFGAGFNYICNVSCFGVGVFTQQQLQRRPPTQFDDTTKTRRGNSIIPLWDKSPVKEKSKDQADNNSDYATFPALDPEVLDTLIRAFDGETLSSEIYQRLHDIYGFSNFNYDSSKVESRSFFSKDALQLHELPAWKDEDISVLHVNPLVLSIDNFFTPQECKKYMKLSTTAKETRSPTAGGNLNATIREQRTSTTWFHYFETVPELMAKASRLLGLRDIRNWEEAQTVRYRPGEQFTWHLDALGGGVPSDEEFMAMGGQRIATLIIYLNDLTDNQGGATMFRDLLEPVRFDDDNDEIVNQGTRLSVRPQQGRALLFFPAAGGLPNVPVDLRTLHCGQQVVATTSNDNDCGKNNDEHDDKWIAQTWLYQKPYTPTAPSIDNRHDRPVVQKAINKYCTIDSKKI